MNQALDQFINSASVRPSIGDFILSLLLGAILAYLLGLVYVRFGKSLSNRKLFSHNFMMITMAIVLIISIVKSSLALSLGLVGALSIVRFRTAIKEPEELAYMFVAIAVGLGLGANQKIITLVAFAIIMLLVVARDHFSRQDDMKNMYLTISTQAPDKIELNEVIRILRQYCLAVDMKRFDEDRQHSEAYFLLEFKAAPDLLMMKDKLQLLSHSLKISYLDNKGVL